MVVMNQTSESQSPCSEKPFAQGGRYVLHIKVGMYVGHTIRQEGHVASSL